MGLLYFTGTASVRLLNKKGNFNCSDSGLYNSTLASWADSILSGVDSVRFVSKRDQIVQIALC